MVKTCHAHVCAPLKTLVQLGTRPPMLQHHRKVFDGSKQLLLVPGTTSGWVDGWMHGWINYKHMELVQLVIV